MPEKRARDVPALKDTNRSKGERNQTTLTTTPKKDQALKHKGIEAIPSEIHGQGQQPLTEESLLKELNVTENVLLILLINKR
ncbi:hypothetical protein HGM15179_005533 [Zosterops borbonicus]|uniref:Uncharacterized protein n=1 Tax=Zosterops borbonicus TaxID=364589 RepID=A0A8K1GNR0_9PASS|nr:hypothetical protein HGM15179_005533 [Zosterops borbonicus]